MNDLAALLHDFDVPKIMVLGDVMLDRDTIGPVARVSPEAPALILQADSYAARPGGAAAVATLLRALDAEVTLAGVIGVDADGRLLERILSEGGIATDGLLRDDERLTTVKERFLGRAEGRQPQQILRVDRECCTELGQKLEDALLATVLDRLAEQQAVLISDYAKGACTPRLIEGVRSAAKRLGIPVLVDPARGVGYERYRGVELLKPNRAEAVQATGRSITRHEDALAAAQSLCRQFDIAATLITLDRDGMALATANGPSEWLPTRPRAICDVTGAGDMVLAMLGLCRAAGWPLSVAAQLANIAAGLQVERPGVAPVSRDEIAGALEQTGDRTRDKIVSLDRLQQWCHHHRRAGRRIAFTNGCFDLLHAGHLQCLEEAASQGDVLVVAVNSDASVRRLKGASRPIVGEDERVRLLAALTCVDHVIVFDDETPIPLLRQLRPDVLVKGGTYLPQQVVGHEIVAAYGGRVCVTDTVQGRSTSHLLAQVHNGPFSASEQVEF